MNTTADELPAFTFTEVPLEDVRACIEQNENDSTYIPSRWEERFDMTHIDAMLHLMHTVCKGLPPFVQRWLLRRAARLPGLHGGFGSYNDQLAFLSIEGEAIGMSETWSVDENGVRKKLW